MQTTIPFVIVSRGEIHDLLTTARRIWPMSEKTSKAGAAG